MKVAEAAIILGIPLQTVRVRMRRGLLPIGIAIKGKKEWSYIIFEAWLDRFMEGEPVTIPEGMTDIER